MEKFIKLEPKVITFVNEKGTPMEGDNSTLDWPGFLRKVETHPKWATTYRLSRYMDEIWDAYKEAESRGDWVMVLKTEPYDELKSACESPRYTRIDPVHGPQEIPGWGVHPLLNRQLLPFTRAIMNAQDKDPRKSADQ